MKPSLFFSFFVFICGLFLILACHEVTVNNPIHIDPYEDPCLGLTENECFETMEQCVKADSIGGFLATRSNYKQDFTHLNPLSPSLESRFPNASFYQLISMLGGGDYDSFPFVTLNNIYCPLTTKNMERAFSPIQSEEEALAYYLFAKQQSGGAFAHSMIYLFDKEHLDSLADQHWKRGDCSKQQVRNLAKKDLFSANSIENGYVLTLTRNQNIYEIKYEKPTIAIGTDGSLHEISNKTLLSCGFGPEF